MQFSIGKLDKVITFQEYTETVDSYGQPIKTWSNVENYPKPWAAFHDEDGRGEFPEARRINAQRIGTFMVRYRTDITTQSRIVWDGANWNIHRIKRSDKRNDHLLILASVIE